MNRERERRDNAIGVMLILVSMVAIIATLSVVKVREWEEEKHKNEPRLIKSCTMFADHVRTTNDGATHAYKVSEFCLYYGEVDNVPR